MCTAPFVDEFIQQCVRRANKCGLNLVQVPADPVCIMLSCQVLRSWFVWLLQRSYMQTCHYVFHRGWTSEPTLQVQGPCLQPLDIFLYVKFCVYLRCANECNREAYIKEHRCVIFIIPVAHSYIQKKRLNSYGMLCLWFTHTHQADVY